MPSSIAARCHRCWPLIALTSTHGGNDADATYAEAGAAGCVFIVAEDAALAALHKEHLALADLYTDGGTLPSSAYGSPCS